MLLINLTALHLMVVNNFLPFPLMVVVNLPALPFDVRHYPGRLTL